MPVHVISYDLKNPGQSYDELHDAIESYSSYTHILDSTWLIDTSETNAGNIRDDLKGHIDTNDRLLVTRMPDSGGVRWGTTFTDEHTEWLKEHL
jgi:hypothetical protein